jgi:hypothetical protein
MIFQNQFFKTMFLAFLSASLLSCEPENSEPEPNQDTLLEMKFQLVHNGELVDLDQTLSTDEGYDFQVKEVKILLTQIKNENLTLVEASKMDLTASGNTLFEGVGKPSEFNNLQGAIGVVQPWNNADPVSFDPSSPLYLSNVNDMHWGWNPGYIFYKFEGVFSPILGSTEMNEIFTYHIGLNEYLEMFSFENITWTKIDDFKYESTVYLHVDKIFNGPGGVVNIFEEPFTHSTPDKAELNEKIAINFANALSID